MARELDPEVLTELGTISDPVIKAAVLARLEHLRKLNAIKPEDNNPERGAIHELGRGQSRRTPGTTGAGVLPKAPRETRPSIDLEALAEKARQAANELAIQGREDASVVLGGVEDGKAGSYENLDDSVVTLGGNFKKKSGGQQPGSNLSIMRQKFGKSLSNLDVNKGGDQDGPYTEIEYGDSDAEVGIWDQDGLERSSQGTNSSKSLKIQLPDLPLHKAIRDNRFMALFGLVEQHRVPVNGVDDAGRTALHVAAELGHAGVAGLLIRRFAADLSIRDHEGRTARDIAQSNGFGAVVEVIDTLEARQRHSTESEKEELPEPIIVSYSKAPLPARSAQAAILAVSPDRSLEPERLNPDTKVKNARGKRGIFGCCEGCVVQ